MDDRRFDDLTKHLGRGHTRRSVLRGLVGGGTALLATGAGSALAKPSPDKKVTVCHYDASTGQSIEISIAQKALAKHLQNNQQDYQGACAACTPVDCQYEAWSDWGACSAECGGGTQTSTRGVVSQPLCGGAACSESQQVQQQGCNTHACPCVPQMVDCTDLCGTVLDNCGGEVECTGGCSCDPVPCTEGVCGNQLDTCGQTIGLCIDHTVTCEPGDCGPLVDACGTQVGNCLDSTKTCGPSDCGPLLDACEQTVGYCHEGCPCEPAEVDCLGLCGTVYDNCGNPVECTDACPCVPEPVECDANACGVLIDNCGNQVGVCYNNCTCTAIYEECTPGVSTCCSFDSGGPCFTHGDCHSTSTGYCC
jgi:hypothetical protein